MKRTASMSDSRNDLFERLFSESRHALRRYVRRYVGAGETAEEIVQEAFLRTYEHAASVQTPAAFLFTTARNLAWKRWRHERIAKTDSIGDIDDTRVITGCESIDDELLADERTRVLAEAIGRLPPQCRAAFTLRVFHACSYKEIAQKLGISARTVEKHIARGLRETHAYVKLRYSDASKAHGRGS